MHTLEKSTWTGFCLLLLSLPTYYAIPAGLFYRYENRWYTLYEPALTILQNTIAWTDVPILQLRNFSGNPQGKAFTDPAPTLTWFRGSTNGIHLPGAHALHWQAPSVELFLHFSAQHQLMFSWNVTGGLPPDSLGFLILNPRCNVQITDSGVIISLPTTNSSSTSTTNAQPKTRLFLHHPVAFQGTTRYPGKFVRKGKILYPTFDGLDWTQPYTIDPELRFLIEGTYLGGEDNDAILDMARAPDGTIYMVGYTSSISFPPATRNAAQPGHAPDQGLGSADAFIIRMDSQLRYILNATYLGGCNTDIATVVKIDTIFTIGVEFNVVVGGRTTATGGLTPYFPVTTTAASWGATYLYSGDNAFISVLSPDLSTLIASTTIGGYATDDILTDIEIGRLDDGGYFIAGYSSANNDVDDLNSSPLAEWPNVGSVLLTVGYDTSYEWSIAGGRHGWIAFISNNLDDIYFVTYIGDFDRVSLWDLEVDFSTETVYAFTNIWDNDGDNVGGDLTASIDAWMPMPPFNEENAYLAAFSFDLSQLKRATYIGSDYGFNTAYEIVLVDNRIVVFSELNAGSSGLPYPFDTSHCQKGAFAFAMDAQLKNILHIYHVGADAGISIEDARYDKKTNLIYVTGYHRGSSTIFINNPDDTACMLHVTDGAYDRVLNVDDRMAYALALDTTLQNVSCTRIGHGADCIGYAILPISSAAHPYGGWVVVAGEWRWGCGLPTRPTSYDPTYNGGYEGFAVLLEWGPDILTAADVPTPPESFPSNIRLVDQTLYLTTTTMAYVGIEGYALDGKLLWQKSAGMLLPGTHTFPINEASIIRIRIGDEVYVIRPDHQ